MVDQVHGTDVHAVDRTMPAVEAIEAAGMELPEPIYRVRTETFQPAPQRRPSTAPDLKLRSDISLKGDPIIEQIDKEREALDDEGDHQGRTEAAQKKKQHTNGQQAAVHNIHLDQVNGPPDIEALVVDPVELKLILSQLGFVKPFDLFFHKVGHGQDIGSRFRPDAHGNAAHAVMEYHTALFCISERHLGHILDQYSFSAV